MPESGSFFLQYVKWSSTARGSTLNTLTSGLFGESGEPDAFFTDEKCRSMFKAHMTAMVNRRCGNLNPVLQESSEKLRGLHIQKRDARCLGKHAQSNIDVEGHKGSNSVYTPLRYFL